MRYCKRCVLPDTKPGLSIDVEGVCSACRSVERKHEIDWEERAARLAKVCDEVRGSNGNCYECIVPVSGGKDSVTQVYYMSQVYNLRTLAVVQVQHLQTIEGIENLNSMVANMGVDLIKVAIRPHTHQKIRRIATLKLGNPSYPEHRVCFSSVAQVASLYGVPLVVWGEDIGVEFGGAVSDTSVENGSAEDLINNDLFRETGFEELLDGAIPANQLFFYDHPNTQELGRRKVRSIYLGYYHWWDGFKNYTVAKRFGFTALRESLAGTVLTYNNIDEKLYHVSMYLKFLKFGFGRATDHVCYNIWNGYMSREEAVEKVNAVQYDLPAYIPEFLEYHQLTEEELWKCFERWRNHDIWSKVNGKWRLKVDLV